LGGEYQKSFEHDVNRKLEEVFVFKDVRLFLKLLTCAVAGVATLMFWLSGNIALSLALILFFGASPKMLLSLARRRRLEAFRQQIPDTLSLIAGGLKAGSSLNQMIAQAADRMPVPASQEFSVMVRQQRMGFTLEQSLRELATRVDTEETKLLVAAIQVGSNAGGNTSGALEVLSESTRRKIALEGKIAALTAQGRLQAWVMAGLPVALGMALFTLDPINMSKLFTTSLGWMVLLVVIVLQALGAWMIRRIVSIEV
jgi:tight adherence protein B